MAGFKIGGEDAGGLVAVEDACGMTDSGEDVGSVDVRHITTDALLLVFVSVCIETPRLEVVEFGGRKFGDFVLVVTDGESNLPAPVFVLNNHSIDIEVHAVVLQRTVICPHVGKTGDVADGLAGQEVGSLGVEIFNSNIQAVLQHAGLQTDVEAASGFPLEFGILDV